MQNITLDYSFVRKGYSENIDKMRERVNKCHEMLFSKQGKGSEFLGWLEDFYTANRIKEIKDIKDTATMLQNKIEVLVVIGIGGSYLGARSVIEALGDSLFSNLIRKKSKYPLVVYAGYNLDTDYHYNLLDFLKDKKFAINVISKSGTTIEPAIAFRLVKSLLEKKEGSLAKDYIIATTDRETGALRELARVNGYKTFSIDSSIGGRYSVLSAVGLFPICVAGIDIDELISGASAYQDISKNQRSDAHTYAIIRNILYNEGKKIEILISYTKALQYFGEWWKQLFGESEGKEGKGIFPASCNFTTDLHSMGQWIQDSERTIFETIISIKKPKSSLFIEKDDANLDNLNFLKGKKLSYINETALVATALAHGEASVPNIKLELPSLNPYYLGQLIYFFEMSCALSGYLLGINPFDQEGVEAYKQNMFALIEKPGFDKKLQKKLKALLKEYES